MTEYQGFGGCNIVDVLAMDSGLIRRAWDVNRRVADAMLGLGPRAIAEGMFDVYPHGALCRQRNRAFGVVGQAMVGNGRQVRPTSPCLMSALVRMGHDAMAFAYRLDPIVFAR